MRPFAIAGFSLPLRDIAKEAGSDKFFCPGSILRVELDPSHPLSYGMSAHTAGFFASSSAYEILAPRSSSDGHGGDSVRRAPDTVQTVARYADKDLLLSGWLEGEQLIASRPAVVQVGVGTGRVVLLGFPAQHRAQSHATFRLLFNAILTSQ